MKTVRTVKVCAGIGDNIWLIQKLVNANERFHFQLPDHMPQRGKQIFDICPQVTVDAIYNHGLPYELIKRGNIQRTWTKWSHVRETVFYLSMNEHLEKGNRIEEFFPDLKTNFRIKWDTEAFATAAVDILSKGEGLPFAIYASSYATSRNWGTWMDKEWAEFISRVYKQYPGFVFIIIGAKWDTDMANTLMGRLDQLSIPYVNTIGQPLSVVTEMLKRVSYFVGFPSGLSILNETLGKDTFMFYSEANKKIMNTWADPARIESGEYKGAEFCEPAKVIDWIFNTYQLLNKI
jgi:ADP-heptose:LPS heptosyltransferase